VTPHLGQCLVEECADRVRDLGGEGREPLFRGQLRFAAVLDAPCPDLLDVVVRDPRRDVVARSVGDGALRIAGSQLGGDGALEGAGRLVGRFVAGPARGAALAHAPEVRHRFGPDEPDRPEGLALALAALEVAPRARRARLVEAALLHVGAELPLELLLSRRGARAELGVPGEAALDDDPVRKEQQQRALHVTAVDALDARLAEGAARARFVARPPRLADVHDRPQSPSFRPGPEGTLGGESGRRIKALFSYFNRIRTFFMPFPAVQTTRMGNHGFVGATFLLLLQFDGIQK
jgi:hypothetical protein